MMPMLFRDGWLKESLSIRVLVLSRSIRAIPRHGRGSSIKETAVLAFAMKIRVPIKELL